MSNLSVINSKKVFKESFVSQRALGSYIAALYSPDLEYYFCFSSQVKDLNRKDENFLASSLNLARKIQVLDFVLSSWTENLCQFQYSCTQGLPLIRTKNRSWDS